jgi:hypothetical protein
VASLAGWNGLFMDCDSIHAIRTWGEQKPGSSIGIRVNPAMGVSRENNDRLQYAGGVTSKFGVYREQFDEALSVAKEQGLTVTKIHFHTGCGYLTPQLPQWDRVIQECLWFVDRCPTVNRVNVGGGLGVPHVHGELPLDLSQWATVLKKHFGGRSLHVEIEPGEYLLKDAGLLLLGKTYDKSVIKRRRRRRRRRRRLLPSHKSKLGTRRRQQHLCLDKAYISEQEEQELIKRGYVLHIPIKKKKKKGGDEVDDEDKTKEAIPNRKKHSPKRWVVERTNSWHNRFRKLFTRYEKKSENYLGLVQFSCCMIIYRKIILG